MNATLTTVQHSALGDLHRFGYLTVPAEGRKCERGTPHGFSRRTMQALVDAGHARWNGYAVSIVPTDDAEEAAARLVESHGAGSMAEAREVLAAEKPKRCRECREDIDPSDMWAGYGFCGSCLHDAERSGWTPGD